MDKRNYQAPSVPPYVWPVAIDPWPLSGPEGQEGEGWESRTKAKETSP